VQNKTNIVPPQPAGFAEENTFMQDACRYFQGIVHTCMFAKNLIPCGILEILEAIFFQKYSAIFNDKSY
jgi:hypothetical protein